MYVNVNKINYKSAIADEKHVWWEPDGKNGEVSDSKHSNWVYLAPSVLWQVNVNYLHVTNDRYECHSTEINYPFIIIII